MKLANKYFIKTASSVRDAMKAINKNKKQAIIVVDKDMILKGIATDGDIRRGLLKGGSIQDNIKSVFNPSPISIPSHIAEKERRKYEKGFVDIYPLIDNKKKVVGVHFKNNITNTSTNCAVIMSGGLGKRLQPITTKIPKALVEVKGKPILERIIESLVDHGFIKIILAVNYKKEAIKEYFGDGKNFGVEIVYLDEKKRMGTAGSLSLVNLEQVSGNNLLVMNCDIVTEIDYTALMNFHRHNKSLATMCVNKFNFKIPYGVIRTEKEEIIKIDEKPVVNFNVNAGIYVLNKKVIKKIPNDTFFDMPSLFHQLIEDKEAIFAFPIHEKWKDIGQIEDLNSVNSEKT